MSKPALIVIDIQNDYFADGSYPLWNVDATLANTEAAIARAQAKGVPVVLVQHVSAKSGSSLFDAGSHGVEIHPRILAAAPNAPVVVKAFADSFHQTQLDATLRDMGVDEIWLCGMMTQNCVTHTALSKAAAKYAVKVLSDCCTTMDKMVHAFAVSALATSVPVVELAEVLPA
jgi:nicotinamidase-related amidase